MICSPHFCWYLQYLVSIFGGVLDLGFLEYLYIYVKVAEARPSRAVLFPLFLELSSAAIDTS